MNTHRVRPGNVNRDGGGELECADVVGRARLASGGHRGAGVESVGREVHC